MRKSYLVVLILCITLQLLSTFAQTPTPNPGPEVTPNHESLTLKPGESEEFKLDVRIADAPIPKIDVVFAIDVTNSMSQEIDVAKSKSISIMDDIRTLVPDSSFGVISFSDYPGMYTYPGYSKTYGSSTDKPFQVNIQPSSDTIAVTSAINSLKLGSGSDEPEDYTRVLYECISLDWRSLSEKIVILIGDAPTHDLTFNGYNFGGDPGRDGIAQTSDDLVFKDIVNQVHREGIVVLAVQAPSDTSISNDATATFKGMSIGFADVTGTGGQYFQLTSADQIPSVVRDMVDATVSSIRHLKLSIPTEYTNWISYSPEEYLDIGPKTIVPFSLTVTAPIDASGSVSIPIQIIGDGALLGLCEVTVTIPTDTIASDLGFRPNPNGYNFQNFPDSVDTFRLLLRTFLEKKITNPYPLTWDMFRQFYGKENTNHTNGDGIYAAEEFYGLYQYFGIAGNCDGFSASSMINYMKLAQPNSGEFAIPNYERLYEVSKDSSINWILYYQGIQTGYEMQKSRSDQSILDPNALYAIIKSSIQNKNSVIIGLTMEEESETGVDRVGHAVAPYRFEEDGSIAHVFIYDCNHPGDNGVGWPFYWRSITFNLKADTYSYDGGSNKFEGTKDESNMVVIPLSMYVNKGIPMWNIPSSLQPAKLASVEGADLTLIDSSGKKAESINGTFISNIPGAVEMIPRTYDTYINGTVVEALFVPGNDSYTARLTGKENGNYSFNSFTGKTLMQILNATTYSSTIDSLTLNPEIRSMTYVTNDLNKQYTAILDDEIASSSRVFVLGTSISVGENTTLALTNDGIKYVNMGESKMFNLKILQKGEGSGDLTLSNITLGAGDTGFVKVKDWNNLENSPIELAIDKGSDGTIEESRTIANGSLLYVNLSEVSPILWSGAIILLVGASIVGFMLLRARQNLQTLKSPIKTSAYYNSKNAPAIQTCINCGSPNNKNAKFCRKCGNRF
jgi:hypothetical protein